MRDYGIMPTSRNTCRQEATTVFFVFEVHASGSDQKFWHCETCLWRYRGVGVALRSKEEESVGFHCYITIALICVCRGSACARLSLP